jgi:hypothetical protein
MSVQMDRVRLLSRKDSLFDATPAEVQAHLES